MTVGGSDNIPQPEPAMDSPSGVAADSGVVSACATVEDASSASASGADAVTVDPSALMLGADDWKRWEQIIDGPPPGDLSAMRAFLARPAPPVAA